MDAQQWPALTTTLEPVTDLEPYARNARQHSDHQIALLADAIEEYGWTMPVLRREDGTLIAGHGRVLAAQRLGLDRVPVAVARGWTEAQCRAYALADNRIAELAEWDHDALALELDAVRQDGYEVAGLGFDEKAMRRLVGDLVGRDKSAPGLADRFGVPPFTVLSARDGWWQDRKEQWLAVGMQSELGRDGLQATTNRTATDPRYAYMNGHGGAAGGSIFDPVLTELIVRWFSAPGATILDPFAGGSVRGLVSGFLGREYVGIDLREDQVAANRAQLDLLPGGAPAPEWHDGDSRELDDLLPDDWRCDLVMTCPPYADLEVYSDDPRDLSTMSYADFRAALGSVVAMACARLRDDRFAAIVVGEVRDRQGHYRGLVPDTVAAFEAAGLRFYNEAVVVTQAGSVPLRAARAFEASRKLGKTHQNLLVFVKGSAKRATEAAGPIEFERGAEPVPESDDADRD